MKFRTNRIWIYTRYSIKWSGITCIHLLIQFNAVQELRYQSWDQVPCWIQSFSVHSKHSLFILDCWHPQVPSCPDRIRHQREHFVRGGDPGLRDPGGGRQGRSLCRCRRCNGTLGWVGNKRLRVCGSCALWSVRLWLNPNTLFNPKFPPAV